MPSSVVGMANHAGTDGDVPENHAQAHTSEQRQSGGAIAPGPHGGEETPPGSRNAQLRALPILPILLGIFICALNIVTIARLWQVVYNGNLAWINQINLPTTVFLILIITSFSIGLFLIAYSLVLRNSERPLRKNENTQESKGASETRQAPDYVKWVIAPLLIALPAPALTVWAAQMIEPIAPKPCIELYQEAQNIRNDNPSFRMRGYDRDQVRCSINQYVLK